MTLNIPERDGGGEYNSSSLYDDQLFVYHEVMKKIHEFITCEDFNNFKPLRCTVNGPAGTGKTVLVQTIVSALRKMFGRNDVVKVIAPTGTAACNVGGETFHHMAELQVTKRDYVRGSMKGKKRKRLVQRFAHLLCLIADERSLVTSQVLGTTEQVISETIFGGGHLSHLSWGGLPVVILVGDDYQLQGTEEGGVKSLSATSNRGAMTANGRRVFKECSETVFKLNQVRRISDDKQEDKDLMNRIRLGDDIQDDDVKRLMKLHIDNIEKQHGYDYVKRIRRDAIYLFYTNEKRARHNLEMVRELSSPHNPVAFVRTISTGGAYGKGIRSHFGASDIPKTALLFQGAKVAIEKRNFCPLWGLHNGACGIVREIIFNENANPNKGDLPDHVVVEFPLYTGPAWDKDNPKVCCAPQ